MFEAPHPRFRLYTRARSYTGPMGRETGDQRDVKALETRLIEETGAADAVCVSQARLGIYLVVKALIRPGQRVIMSPYTIVDVVNMVICAGGRPLFADVEPDTCNIDPGEVERLLHEDDVGLVLATHLHGVPADTFRLLALCRDNRIPLVEDAAQAFGAQQEKRWLGAIGDAGIYSFGMYKHVNAWYGGAVVLRDEALGQRIRNEVDSFRLLPRTRLAKKMQLGWITDLVTHPAVFKSSTYWMFRYGFLHEIGWINRRVDPERDIGRKDEIPRRYLTRLRDAQARLILDQLPGLAKRTAARRERAGVYRAGLKTVVPLTFVPEEREPIYTYFPLQAPEPEQLLRHLFLRRRDVAAQHLHNCADLPAFSEFHRPCP
ncbi:MAG: DegT/DnrJ/EryC1/StrS family aminotransferase, partial [Verrucomicrobiota bacterium]